MISRPAFRQGPTARLAAIGAAILVIVSGCGAKSPAAASENTARGVAFTLYHHCGIATVPFAGRMWRSSDPVPTPEPDADGTVFVNGSTDGTMTLVSQDRAEFSYKKGTGSALLVFVPTTATPPPCA